MLLNSERARAVMVREGIDALVASTIENIYYLSGMWQMVMEVLPYEDQCYVVAPRESPEAGIVVIATGEADLALHANSTIAGVIAYGRSTRALPSASELLPEERRIVELTIDKAPRSNAVDALVAALEETPLSGRVVGIDERGPNRMLLEEVRRRLPDLEFRPASAIFREIRAVKTEEEQRRIVDCLRATERAIRATLSAVRPGITERQLAHTLECGLTEAGARPGFTQLRVGRCMALAQVPPGDTALLPGDYLFIDAGGVMNGYRSDIGRIFPFGEPNKKLRRLHEAIRAGHDLALEVMTPGRPVKEVFDLAMARVREAGIPHFQRSHIGHGVGLEYYDAPLLSPDSDAVLEAGMTFEVEVNYYELGFGGIFLEDTVLVTETGGRVLTELDRDLQVINI